MNIKRAKQEIINAIEAYLAKDENGEYRIPPLYQRPILLLGAPGIGKTHIMEQVARECKVALVSYTITHHTRQSAIGLPFLSKEEFGGKEYTVTEYTMSEIVASLYQKMKKTGLSEGILFIDEINCVSETLAPAMLQFLQYKTFGSHPIPEGWVIVAAGNPPEYNRSVRDFDVVTLDRVKKIEVQPELDVWREYAYEAGIHPAILSYLAARPGNFYRMETTVDGLFFTTPRGWEDLSRMLVVYDAMGKPADQELVLQYLQHPEIARDFANFLELYKKYEEGYQIDGIFRGSIPDALLLKAAHASFDERVSLVGLLLARCAAEIESFQAQEDLLAMLHPLLLQAKRMSEPLPVKADAAERADTLGDADTVARASALEGAGTTARASALGDADTTAKASAMQDTDTPRGTHTLREASSQPSAVYARLLQHLSAEREERKRAELLTRPELTLYRKAEAFLNSLILEIQSAPAPLSPEAAFALAKKNFQAEKDRFDTAYEAAGAALEHAFDFLEAAFGPGQELVLFVTQLNTSRKYLRFLEEYECERYYQYNKELLYDERERILRRKLDELL